VLWRLPNDGVSQFIELEPGSGNIDLVDRQSDFYPYNFVFSVHGVGGGAKDIIYAYLENSPCGSIELTRPQAKYSIYCSLPFPSRFVNLDFYKFDGSRLVYLPKRLGYAHFSSSAFSGGWERMLNSAPKSYSSRYEAHSIFVSSNHREVIFVDGATNNITQRVSYPIDFELGSIHLYDSNFIIVPKGSGKPLVFNYL
jgi:hypothetical protein